jgi:rod shape-determining protein MreD
VRINQRPPLLYFLIIAGLVLLQTTLFRFINLRGTSPDLVLIFLFFAAHFRGAMDGQLMGFMAGILEDCLGLGPFGFNTLIRTVIGFTAGLTHGKIFFDSFVLPLAAVLTVGLLKQVLVFLLSVIFIKEAAGGVWGLGYWIEMGLTLVLTPVLYFLFRTLGFFVEKGRHII